MRYESKFNNIPHAPRRLYMDNAATSFPKPATVTDAMVPDAPGRLLGVVGDPDRAPPPAVVDVVDAPEDPPQAATPRPATPTAASTASCRTRWLATRFSLSPDCPLVNPGRAADTRSDDFGFWLYSSGSTGKPKGTVHTHANLYWTAELYAKPVLALTEDDVCFSAAKLFFAFGLGNGLTFPLSVGASVVLMAERPTPQATFKRWLDRQPTVFFGAPTGFAPGSP